MHVEIETVKDKKYSYIGDRKILWVLTVTFVAVGDALRADGKDVSQKLDWKSLVKYDTQSSFQSQSFKEDFRRTVET